MNSICILFLIIGVAGAKSGGIALKPPPPLATEAIAVVVEPPPPAADAPPKPEQMPQPNQDAARVVVAVPDSPAIQFSVPTVANVLAPSGVPTTPPVNPMQPVVPLRNRPTIIKSGGGERPAPDYPAYLQERGEHGAVTLSITVSESGVITDVKVSHSSGFPDLDKYTLKYVKEHWVIPPIDGSLLYETTINFLR